MRRSAHHVIRSGILLLVSIMMLTSCVVNKPYSSSKSTPDYNGRVEINDAYYKRKPSVTGYTMMGVSAAGGGVAGYFTPMVHYYDGNQRKELRPVNAAIGAVIGFGTSYLINRMLGWGKVKEVKKPEKWIRKADKEFLILSQDNPANFVAMNASVQYDYEVKNLKDVEDFHTVFPESDQADIVVGKAIPVLAYSELPVLLELYPSTSERFNVIKRYFLKSPSFEELVSGEERYSSEAKRIDLETTFAQLCRNLDQAEYFIGRYPDSDLFELVENGVVKSVKSVEDAARYLNLFPETPFTDRLAFHTVDYLRTAKDLNVFKVFFDSEKYEQNLIDHIIDVFADNELPDAIKTLRSNPAVRDIKAKYLTNSDGYDAFINRLSKYPEMNSGVKLTKSKTDRNIVRQNVLAIEDMTFLGTDAFRISKDLKDQYLLGRKTHTGTSLYALNSFKNELLRETWLVPVSKKYLEEVKVDIRKESFRLAKQKGVPGLIDFTFEYPDAPEIKEVEQELTTYINNNTSLSNLNIAVLGGDRGISNDIIDMAGAAFSAGGITMGGGNRYNIFIQGELTNHSSDYLPVQIGGKLNVINTTYVKIIITIPSTSRYQRETTSMHWLIPPKASVPFLIYFQNFQEGGGLDLGYIGGSNISELDPKKPYQVFRRFSTKAFDESLMEKQIREMNRIYKRGNLKVSRSLLDKWDSFWGMEQGSTVQAMRNSAAQIKRESDAARSQQAIDDKLQASLDAAQEDFEKKQKDAEQKRKDQDARNCLISAEKLHWTGETHDGYPASCYEITCWNGEKKKYTIAHKNHIMYLSGCSVGIGMISNYLSDEKQKAIKAICDCK